MTVIVVSHLSRPIDCDMHAQHGMHMCSGPCGASPFNMNVSEGASPALFGPSNARLEWQTSTPLAVMAPEMPNPAGKGDQSVNPET